MIKIRKLVSPAKRLLAHEILGLKAGKFYLGFEAISDGNPKSKSIKLEYTALPYYWGDDDAAHKIYVYSNEEFGEDWDAVWPLSTSFIQNDLREALLQLRSEQDEVYLWCDAICINQANNKEKATQVARMREFCTFAKSVCDCLGTNNEQGATDDTDVDAEGTKLIAEFEKAIEEEKRAEAIAEAEMKAESAEAKDRREARAERRLTHEDTKAAVETLRAIHQTTAPLRHNKWRKPNAGFTNKNIRIIGKIGEGGFGAVYLIENIETKVQYAMKTQLIRENDDEPMMTPPAWRGAKTPPVTPSS
ncbi:hypothetical protein BOTNAR_0308g00060 [Botryotinia narcissicola]|uniref:Heterokaryon incompatibility domain-containing protein n=1 Tax=Botryotinia narcissicola TaxID=278944 RepID=A0A4Z1HVF7_9HELO|nr:hypothetical protein BOTNAR_0308g00060 [Botryotinia narcissicola]